MKSKTVLLLAAILLTSTNVQSEEFEKFTFWDPYFIIVAGPGHAPPCINDTTGLAPDSYFAQLDSLGITLTLSVADSQSTNNPYGIKIWGSGSLIKPRIDAGYLANIVWGAHNIYAEVEYVQEDSMEGAYWENYDMGMPYSDEQETGRIYRSGADSPGLILTSQGKKFRPLSTTGCSVRPRAKVWDTSTTDTIFHMRVHYNTCVGVDTFWTEDTVFYTGQDFFHGDAGEWQLLYGLDVNLLTWRPFTVRFHWYGNDSLAIDKVIVLNYYGQVLESTTAGEFDSAFADFYSDINVEGHGKFYACDEPLPIQYFGIQLFDYFASAGPYTTHRTVQAVRWDIPYYIYALGPDDVLSDAYTIRTYHDSSTSCSVDTCSIQDAYNDLTAWIRERANHILPQGIDFWMYLQGGLANDWDRVMYRRDPTPNEIKAQA